MLVVDSFWSFKIRRERFDVWLTTCKTSTCNTKAPTHSLIECCLQWRLEQSQLFLLFDGTSSKCFILFQVASRLLGARCIKLSCFAALCQCQLNCMMQQIMAAKRNETRNFAKRYTKFTWTVDSFASFYISSLYLNSIRIDIGLGKNIFFLLVHENTTSNITHAHNFVTLKTRILVEMW